jgi:hypothetical protein
LSLKELVRLGRRPCVNEQEAGVRDRELQDVYLWRSSAPLEAYQPQPVEVHAILEVPLTALLELFAGGRERITARALTAQRAIETVTIGADDFVPTLDSYFFRAAVVIDHALQNYPYLVV